MQERLTALLGATPGMRSVFVGSDVVGGPNHRGVGFTADFDDRSALDAHQAHRDHRSAIEWMADFAVARTVVDLEPQD